MSTLREQIPLHLNVASIIHYWFHRRQRDQQCLGFAQPYQEMVNPDAIESSQLTDKDRRSVSHKDREKRKTRGTRRWNAVKYSVRAIGKHSASRGNGGRFSAAA